MSAGTDTTWTRLGGNIRCTMQRYDNRRTDHHEWADYIGHGPFGGRYFACSACYREWLRKNERKALDRIAAQPKDMTPRLRKG